VQLLKKRLKLYTGLIEMQELWWGRGGAHWPRPSIHKEVRPIYA